METLYQTAAMVTAHAHIDIMMLQLSQSTYCNDVYLYIILPFLVVSTRPFPQLSLVYGMLAKFPVDLLVEKVTTESRPFLIVFYDHLLSLGQRYV